VPAAALICSRCAAPDDAATWHWRCPRCGGPLDFAEQPPPLEPLVTLGEPQTPLVKLAIGGIDVLAKLEGALPSGSFKDRGSRTVVSALRADGRRHALTDSSGNAGASLAAYCARAGVACDVYVPEDTAPAKLTQIEALGASVVRVRGSRSQVAEAAVAAAGDEATYVPHGWTPWFLLGTASFAHELAGQLGRAPDAIVLPVGSGTLLLGVARGFEALARTGEVSRGPRLYAVQSAACAPLADAAEQGLEEPVPVEPGPTAADGIRIARPPRGVQILAAVRASGGTVVRVADDQLWAAFDVLASQGVLVEPTSAVAFAALDQLPLATTETVVVAITASGLKSIDAIARRPRV
jgi:threonine synthase